MAKKIFQPADPVTGEQVYVQTHADAVIFEDGENLSQKVGAMGGSAGSFMEDVADLVSELRVNVNSSYPPDNYITVVNDVADPHNGVITVVKAQTQGRFGWHIGRLLPLRARIDVDVSYDGSGTCQGYYSENMRTIASYVEGAVISKDKTHLSFYVNSRLGLYVFFEVTNLTAGKTITFSNFRVSYDVEWDEYIRFANVDYATETMLKVAGSTSEKVTLLHFSDIHGDARAAAYIRRFYDRNNARIDDMINTGDIVYIKFGDDFSFYTENELDNALLALGNHDGASSDGEWTGKERSDVYDRYMNGKASLWGITQPTGADENFLFYYYKDYSALGLRLIVLDGVHQDADQLAWFQATLSSARAAGYKIVVASHYLPGTFNESMWVKNHNDVAVNFASRSWELTSILPYAVIAEDYADAVDDFIADGGSFVIWLCGHYHTNAFTYLNDHPNILVSCIDQAGTLRNHSLYRESDIPTEVACANVVIVTATLIRLIRVGYHQDGALRQIHSMCYDYVNRKLISEN